MARRWPVREIPAPLCERYVAEGLWTDQTLGGLVLEGLRDAPEQQFRVWSAQRPWHGTYADIEADARRLLRVLQQRGLGPGDVVAFQIPNWQEAAVAFYATALGGLVMVPIVHIYGRKEVAFILRQSHSVAYLSADRFGHVDYLDIVDRSAAELPDLRIHLVIGETTPAPAGIERVGWDVVTAAAPDGADATPDVDDVAVLAYTSGTTADPKGVMHSHRTLVAEVRQMTARMVFDRPTLMGSPVTHATGMLGALLTPLYRRDAIHIIDRWDPGEVLGIMREARVSSGNGASFFLASLIDHPEFTPEHAELMGKIGLGGAPVPIALAERAASKGIRIIRSYGSTEHPSVTGSSYDAPEAKRHATDGNALDGVELRLVDDDGVEVPVGVAGEIFSRGPELCLGYTDPELTASTFDGDGWYRTGDMGVLDADGYLTITDRVKDVIIRGGENISPAEVEEILAVMPGVAEVAVVAAPDPRMGEHGCALIRLLPGAEAPTLEQLRARLEAEGLARQKWPEELRVVTDFPRTGSGKIRKVDLRRQLREEAAGAAGA